MSDQKTFYITTPIYYPNGKPHMGHAYSTLVCDVLARYHRSVGDDTYFLTGTDENTSKVVDAAKKVDKDPRDFTDEIVDGFKSFYEMLNISYDRFIRTSDEEIHWPGAIEVWKRLEASGDLYKDVYKGYYCVGCETFKTEKELVDGKCADHPSLDIQEIEEENYFFKLSKYTDKIKQLIESDELLVTPISRKNEILSLLNDGLHDVSFSRPAKAIPWGIPVPGDESQTMYVWCDALTNYLSGIGFGRDSEEFEKYWPANTHVIGKDILRFHAAIWPGMLLSAGIPLPKSIFVHGMLLSGGTKMSKTLGNVLDPVEFQKKYGTDALRYYLIREVSPFEDGDITEEKFHEAYTANLVNGLGNQVSRIMTLAQAHLDTPVDTSLIADEFGTDGFQPKFAEAFEVYDIQKAADVIWKHIGKVDEHIQTTEPFKKIKLDDATEQDEARAIIKKLVGHLWVVATHLEPLLPETAEKIKQLVKDNKKPGAPLFERIDLA